MSVFKVYGGSPAKTYRAKTEYMNTNDNSKITELTLSSSARDHVQGSYLDIAVSRSKFSQREGYSSKRKNNRTQHSQTRTQNEHKKCLVFRNLQEFEAQLKLQRGRLDKMQSAQDAFGIGTYRGVKKSINSHQIGVHIGQLTSLTLIEGYDGYYAAAEIKKTYNNQLLLAFKYKKSFDKQQPFHSAEQSIKKALENTKNHLRKHQKERGDNSGASFLSVVAYKGMILTVNCGSSEALCLTNQGRMLKLAKSHTTKNDQEVERIVREGGQLYQTTVNFPYSKQQHITGPLRIHPDGLTVTRTLGKTLSTSRQKKFITSSGAVDNTKGVLSIPQYQYIPASEVRWVAIICSRITELVDQTRIRDIIQQELFKSSNSYTPPEAAEHACKRIILESVESGATDSLSCLILIGNMSMKQQSDIHKQEGLRAKLKVTPPQTKQTLQRQPRSLRYIGNRSNFAQLLSQQ